MKKNLKNKIFVFLIIFTTYSVEYKKLIIMATHMALTDEFWCALFISFVLGLISSSTLMPKIKYTLKIIYNILFYTVIVIILYYIKYYDLY